jgi:hypothetical protein
MPLEGTMASFVFHSPHRRALLIGTLLAAAITAHAKDFRIETKIYVGDAKQPASEMTTFFVERVVYDFIADPEQVAIFNRPSGSKPGQFILLDPPRRIKTKLATDRLAGAMDKVRTWAGKQSDPFLKFAANPDFKESFESGSGKLVLANYLETYTVNTQKAEYPESLTQYREFLDWYSRLNTLLSAGPPPEPRLRLNEALVRHKVIPLKVELARAEEKEPIRAEHQFVWRLSKEDHAQINDVGTSITSYREVSNEEFLRATRPDAESK